MLAKVIARLNEAFKLAEATRASLSLDAPTALPKSALTAAALQVELSPAQARWVEFQFGVYLFTILIKICTGQTVKDLEAAKKIFEYQNLELRQFEGAKWRRKHRPKLGGLRWPSLPYYAATAALSQDEAALARFMEYTAKTLVIYRQCNPSLRLMRSNLYTDKYGVWADFARALAALIQQAPR
jgi:hypothetical protein